MKIRNISIRNFRGIQNLDWNITNPVNCLIGPGDSTKSTILDALEFVLFPHWNLVFSDTDFFNCDITATIELACAIAQLPNEIMALDKYGEYLRGWNSTDGVIDEPDHLS